MRVTSPSAGSVGAAIAVPALAVVAAIAAMSRLSVDLVLATAVGAVALTATVVHLGLERVAQGLLLLAVATSSWNAVSVGPLKPTHAALACAAGLLGFVALTTDRTIRVPAWVWLLGASIAAATVVSLVLPPSPAYFTARYIGDLPDDVAATVDRLGVAGAANGVQWLVAGLALPVAVCLASLRRPRLVPVLAAAWSIGAAVSAAVALGDRFGITTLSAALLPEVDSSRQAGLAVHPNHLALSLALTLPLVAWHVVRVRGLPARLSWSAGGVLMLAGVVASGSRTGLVGAALALAVVLVTDPRARRLFPVVGAAAVGLAILVLALVPSLVESVLADLRLTGSSTAAASDEIRAGLLAQALADVEHAPVHGIGLAVVAEGHNIYLQLLAGGGVVLLVGYLLSQIGFLLTAWTVGDGGSGLARALAVSGIVYLVAGAAGNQLTDVFVAVPFALVAGLWAAEREARCHADVPTGAERPHLDRQEISA